MCINITVINDIPKFSDHIAPIKCSLSEYFNFNQFVKNLTSDYLKHKSRYLTEYEQTELKRRQHPEVVDHHINDFNKYCNKISKERFNILDTSCVPFKTLISIDIDEAQHWMFNQMSYTFEELYTLVKSIHSYNTSTVFVENTWRHPVVNGKQYIFIIEHPDGWYSSISKVAEKGGYSYCFIKNHPLPI